MNKTELAQRRSDLYSLFSRLLLQEVDLETLKYLKNSDSISDIFPNIAEWKPWFEESDLNLLNQYLNVDFTDISLLHLVPYETFYTRDDQMVETGGANPVTDFYHRFGFKVEFDEARVVSSDHIGVELEFMSKLVASELEALKNGDEVALNSIVEAQKEFFKKHLVNWVSLYLINVKYEARTPFYYDLAESTLAFILEDGENL
ncbi:putative component of anaerobic dehydrogenase [Thiovulum sp. ES]|nr:putative component of anaerobic dehydrogenase [Thiovulum sp. ES]